MLVDGNRSQHSPRSNTVIDEYEHLQFCYVPNQVWSSIVVSNLVTRTKVRFGKEDKSSM